LTENQNRDRLELYAWHKQAVSGDAPLNDPNLPHTLSVLEKAKLEAWKRKRGNNQETAMKSYLNEASRQSKIYGTPHPHPHDSQYCHRESSNHNDSSDTHTRNNNHMDDNDNHSSSCESPSLTPRGLAAIPLLCAAASETRPLYLARMRSTQSPSNGWWRRQEPLCADANTYLAIPESLLIQFATHVEWLAIYTTSNHTPTTHTHTQTQTITRYFTSSIPSFLWPLHNILLVTWMLILFLYTFLASNLLALQTLLLGRKRTNTSIHHIYQEELLPSQKALLSLTQSHQFLSVKLLGLVLYPLLYLLNITLFLKHNNHHHHIMSSILPASSSQIIAVLTYNIAFALTWWYWILVLPWFAFLAIFGAIFCLGPCYALIDLAGIE